MASEKQQESVDVGRVPDVGEVIQDRYRLDSVVATGGMGVIMRATQLAMERDVAVKLLHPHMASNEETVARFEREVHLAKHLSHPHTIQLFDFGKTEGGSLYIVMEYLDGRDLKEILNQEGPLPLGRAAEIGLQTLDGLAEAHDHDVIHRDLKPSNIYVEQDRRGDDFVKILDFGIAKSLEGGGTALTATGQVCGTPQYMAPEAVLRRSSGKPGDVYAMGLILFEMLIGRRVFDAGSMPQTIMLQLNQPVPVPDRVADTKFKRIIERSTAKHPDDRYQNADEMFEDLARVVDDLPQDLRLDFDEIPSVEPPGSSDMLEQLPREVDNQGIEMLDRREEADSSSDVIPEPTPDAEGNGDREGTPSSSSEQLDEVDVPSPPPESRKTEDDAYETGDTLVTPEPPSPSELSGDEETALPGDETTEQPAPPSPSPGSDADPPGDPDETMSDDDGPEPADVSSSQRAMSPDETSSEDGTGPVEQQTETDGEAAAESGPRPAPTTQTALDPNLDVRDPKILVVAAGVILAVGVAIVALNSSNSRDQAVAAAGNDRGAGDDSPTDSPGAGGGTEGSDNADDGADPSADDHLAAGSGGSDQSPDRADNDDEKTVAFEPDPGGGGDDPDPSTADGNAGGEASGGTDNAETSGPVTVEITTYPSRAAVFRNGDRLGLTPHEVELPADIDTTDFRVIRKGYYPKTFEVTPSEKTDYRISLERRSRRQAREADDNQRTGGAAGSESSGRSSDEKDEDEIENILDQHTLD